MRENEKLSIAIDAARMVLNGLMRMTLARPIDSFKDQYRLAGLLTWDVFSNNHTVIVPSGKALSIGTWRGSGRVIGDLLNSFEESDISYRYIDFYMGTYLGPGEDEVLFPYYVRAFGSLKKIRCDWVYTSPEEFFGVSPSKLTEFASVSYDSRYELDVVLPVIVRAYREVYNKSPEGWSSS